MSNETPPIGSLRASLNYQPQPLKFGTSGRRGEVIHLTQLEIYLNARAELDYLLALPAGEGGIRAGREFFFACDLRPSSTRFVAEQGGRGEIAQAIEQAIADAGLQPVNLGAIPTPALMAFAMARGSGSMMITGSHIPFDRNGYKTNSAKGELLKKDEAPINERVAAWRTRLYAQPIAESAFAENGNFKNARSSVLAASAAGRDAYLRRYTEFFAGQSLRGLRLAVYQHSAVGRELLVELLQALGAEAIPAGRSETFVPIDTEAIDDATLENIRRLAEQATAAHERVDAVVSTDGDSDRPLLVGIDYNANGQCVARFFGGDLVGMVVAEYLGADAVVVPVSCNDAIDRGPLKSLLEPKTRIGSPFVIAGMEAARAKGKQRICGWEANGGFLTGSDIERNGRVLTALPTRDAFLPILCVLFKMVESRQRMSGVFGALPRRFSRAALIRKFPRAASWKIIEALSPVAGQPFPPPATFAGATADKSGIPPMNRSADRLPTLGVSAGQQPVADRHSPPVQGGEAQDGRGGPPEDIKHRLQKFFTSALGFGAVERVDYTDGVRIYFANGDVAHVRPSGNADELRIYAVADTQARADEITRLGVAEPDGILRQLERAFA